MRPIRRRFQPEMVVQFKRRRVTVAFVVIPTLAGLTIRKLPFSGLWFRWLIMRRLKLNLNLTFRLIILLVVFLIRFLVIRVPVNRLVLAVRLIKLFSVQRFSLWLTFMGWLKVFPKTLKVVSPFRCRPKNPFTFLRFRLRKMRILKNLKFPLLILLKKRSRIMLSVRLLKTLTVRPKSVTSLIMLFRVTIRVVLLSGRPNV